MFSCLVLYHSTISSLTKCRILRYTFHKEDFEIEVIGNRTVIIYIRNIHEMKVWQAVMNIEMMDILVGYGFGNQKDQTRISAFNRLRLIRKGALPFLIVH